MRAWLFQGSRQKAKHGAKCPWSVGWYDPEGKKRSKSIGAKSTAERFRRKVEGELAAGTYKAVARATWEEFVAEYESKVMVRMSPGTRESTMHALNHFVRIINPKRMAAIKTKTISDYVAARHVEPKRKGGPPVSPATVNKELRTIRAMLKKAVRRGYLAECPDFSTEFLREPGKLATYVPPEDFQAIYDAADSARWPDCGPFDPGDWWRGILVMAYMTGWRIGALMALRWADVDVEAATALSRASDNKGKRDQLVPLHPLVVEHLRPLVSFHAKVFPWNRSERAVFGEFGRLQRAAGVKPMGGKPQYGFHDLRRGFATLNAENLTADALQLMMQHRDYTTTQRYINMAKQTSGMAEKLFVPEVKRGTGVG
jgi:integrase